MNPKVKLKYPLKVKDTLWPADTVCDIADIHNVAMFFPGIAYTNNSGQLAINLPGSKCSEFTLVSINQVEILKNDKD